MKNIGIYIFMQYAYFESWENSHKQKIAHKEKSHKQNWHIQKNIIYLIPTDFGEYKEKAQSMYSLITKEPYKFALGYSNIASHWLNMGPPCGLPSGFLWGNQCPMDSEAYKKWFQASLNDWKKFLILR